MQRIYTGNNPEMFAIVRGLLEAASIPVLEQKGGYGRICPSLWLLNDEDYDRAIKLLDDNRPTPRMCPNCGYDLFGLPEPRCPECGEPFRRPEKSPDWQCPECGEKIEGQFTACWKCGYEQPSDETK